LNKTNYATPARSKTHACRCEGKRFEQAQQGNTRLPTHNSNQVSSWCGISYKWLPPLACSNSKETRQRRAPQITPERASVTGGYKKSAPKKEKII